MMAASDKEQPSIELLSATNWKDYELLDSGNGWKLERFGAYTFVRPEHQAIWSPAYDERIWHNADAQFVVTQEESGGHWNIRTHLPESWLINYQGLTMKVRPSNSRHLGVFPEQAVHWDWIDAQIKKAGRDVSVLNLFGYTGIASLSAARAGARVTHVDASKKAISQARENQVLSHLDSAPIRWILDDVVKFVRREVRRGVEYSGVILDPPKFGRGPKGEVWEFFDMLPDLLREILPLFRGNPRFIVITAYAIRASALTLYYALNEMLADLQGKIIAGELVAREQSAGRQISLAICARWSSMATQED